MNTKCIEIYFSIASKDALVDFMLSEGYEDLYFSICSHYGAGALLSSAEEQVSARREFGMFKLFLPHDEASSFAFTLRARMQDKSIRIISYDIGEL